jgi:hypothetical protein
MGCLDPTVAGAACEDLLGTQVHDLSLPDGRACIRDTPAGPAVLASQTESETQICLQTLGSIFASQCAQASTLAPCLCGDAIDPAQCLAGIATPVGPVYDLYACDTNSTNVAVIVADFTSPAFGTGVANAIVQCASAFGCNCF